MRAEHLRLKPALMEAIDRDPDFQMYKEVCFGQGSNSVSEEYLH